MSILKASLLAAALAFVAASSANAMTAKQCARAASANAGIAQTNQWDVNSPAPFSREANERFTW